MLQRSELMMIGHALQTSDETILKLQSEEAWRGNNC